MYSLTRRSPIRRSREREGLLFEREEVEDAARPVLGISRDGLARGVSLDSVPRPGAERGPQSVRQGPRSVTPVVRDPGWSLIARAGARQECCRLCCPNLGRSSRPFDESQRVLIPPEFGGRNGWTEGRHGVMVPLSVGNSLRGADLPSGNGGWAWDDPQVETEASRDWEFGGSSGTDHFFPVDLRT
jgi:hypothetical protein